MPVIEGGVPGWPSWLGAYREYVEAWSARRAARRAAAISPALCWERHALFSDAGWKLRDATGCRWILEVNAPLCDERERYGSLLRRDWARAWERDVLLAADEIVAVSTWLGDWLASLGCENVRVIPNGVQPHAGDREGTRARLGIESKFVLGFLGSMKPWHGVERLPELLDAIPGSVGLMVGEGPVVVRHPRIIAFRNVAEAVAADLVAAMDVGLAPYAPGAPPWFSPMKIFAYRAQGTPVVASDVGDCAALVGDGGTVTSALRDAIESWRGRRADPCVRSWEDVVREAGVEPRRGAPPPPR
jgi:glycosyltransferase involved in cell wall biosynthesis